MQFTINYHMQSMDIEESRNGILTRIPLMIPNGFDAQSSDSRLFAFVRRESGTTQPMFIVSTMDTDTDIAPQTSSRPVNYSAAIMAVCNFMGMDGDFS